MAFIKYLTLSGGLASWGARWVAGPRREEVAVLAGMNSDYYARLEQGRECSASPQILDAISGALRMDDAAREHLYRLAGAVRDDNRDLPREAVGMALKQLLDGYTNAPAFVLNPPPTRPVPPNPLHSFRRPDS
ncbi:hypothetical protein GCM10010446_64860 [Streptomyces enissocaesilis]|uniref:XRE family transcriptional regulator n=1 Tax=Streptomyces enissocaesilis TaxID=332589 RepID=A0ABP6K4D6_9ACTN